MESNTPNLCSDQLIVEEKEPLFIEDRTHNFQLDQAIQYNSQFNNKNKSNIGHKQNACWNCGSTDHSLQGCPVPRNNRMISQNRHAFLMQKQMQQQQYASKNSRFRSGGRKNVRYFVDETQDLCSRFTPGKISDDLLEILGVPKNGIPLHVYKMREHGYPSGWLEEAREEYSGISIFTAPNECLPFPGKVKGDAMSYCTLNEKKLHQYPGFNAPCPPDYIDEYQKIGCPKFNPDQNLKLMYERLITSNDPVTKTFIGIKEEAPKYEIKVSKCVKEDNDGPESSLEDGEITDDENESLPNDCVPVALVEKQDDLEMSVDADKSVNDKTVSISSTSESLVSTPPNMKRNFGDIKSEILGTPVIKHLSPYENRPAHEHFAKGMVDMVDHENLPNAIGTFKKLKNILNDVRKTMNNLL